jgi:LuxR family maltose regulon positive regulatory protein
MAEPGGYMRIFIDTGESARTLLSAYLKRPNPTNKSFATKILKEFDANPQAQNSSSSFEDPLTSRELEVLNHMAEGLSNRQIAQKLVLTEGTIKFHVHNILEKLQVESRTQAILKVKKLDL